MTEEERNSPFGQELLKSIQKTDSKMCIRDRLWAVNPNYVSIKLSGKMYLQSNAEEIIEGYSLNFNGTAIEVDRRYICLLYTSRCV